MITEQILKVPCALLDSVPFQFYTFPSGSAWLSTADILSRALLQNLTAGDTQLQEDCDANVVLQIANIPATESM